MTQIADKIEVSNPHSMYGFKFVLQAIYSVGGKRFRVFFKYNRIGCTAQNYEGDVLHADVNSALRDGINYCLLDFFGCNLLTACGLRLSERTIKKALLKARSEIDNKQCELFPLPTKKYFGKLHYE